MTSAGGMTAGTTGVVLTQRRVVDYRRTASSACLA
jgi:hypothetical protein